MADGTIYLYFRSKEAILVSLFDEVMTEHLDRSRRELRRIGPNLKQFFAELSRSERPPRR